MALPALALVGRGLLRLGRGSGGGGGFNPPTITPPTHTSVNVYGDREIIAALRQLRTTEANIALAAGLNRTGLAIERRSIMEMSSALDRPTPFTLSAIARYKADRNRLSTKVFVKPTQARYLEPLVRGGTLPTVLTPILVKPDAHGNIRVKRRALEGIKGSARTKFVATINGVTGVWQRHGPKGRKLKLLVRVDRDARREKQWDFYKIAERTVQQRLIKDMRDTLADALRLTAERARWR
ncbi:MAG: helix-turn-helix domain-containing protein [Chromatiaceae bacterium]|nr:helix-turn-helix domain-containing protein [Chromatiaceae bacterium]